MGWRRAYRSISQFLTISPCQLSQKADRDDPNGEYFPPKSPAPLQKKTEKHLSRLTLICIYFLIFELFRWSFILSTSSRISSQHPLRKQTASSPGSLIINSTPAIFDTAQRFALSSKPVVLWSEWLCWSWDQTSAKLGSSSEHTFHQHIATLGRPYIAASLQPDVIKL